MSENSLNTVEMVRRIRDAQYELVKDMSHEERIAFYRARAQQFYAKLEKGNRRVEPQTSQAREPSETP